MLPDNTGVNFIKPEMVTKIPDVIPPPKQGPLDVVDEVSFFCYFIEYFYIILLFHLHFKSFLLFFFKYCDVATTSNCHTQ